MTLKLFLYRSLMTIKKSNSWTQTKLGSCMRLVFFTCCLQFGIIYNHTTTFGNSFTLSRILAFCFKSVASFQCFIILVFIGMRRIFNLSSFLAMICIQLIVHFRSNGWCRLLNIWKAPWQTQSRGIHQRWIYFYFSIHWRRTGTLSFWQIPVKANKHYQTRIIQSNTRKLSESFHVSVIHQIT